MADENPDLVTIKKSDLDLLQKSYQLFSKLWDHPEHGESVKRTAHAVDPSIPIPEIELADRYAKPVNDRVDLLAEENKKLREEIEKDREERKNDRELGTLRERLEAAQKKYRLSDEGMAEVRKQMSERHIADPDAAAAWVVSEIDKTPAEPVAGSNFGPSDINVLGMDGKSEDASVKELHENPLKWMDKEVPKILAELDGQEAA